MSRQENKKLSPAHEAFRSLLRTGCLLRRVMEPFFAQFGISGAQWGVLRSLYRAEQEGTQSLRATDLGGRLAIRPPSVSGVVDRLERQGLIVRAGSPDDLRAKHVSLTPHGRKLIQRVLDGLSEKVPSVMGGLEPAEQVELGRLLKKLVNHLEPIARQVESAGE
jgi:DNA-binding MarR family transcriptional regulator